MPALSVVQQSDPPDRLAQLTAERDLIGKDLAAIDSKRARLSEAESGRVDAERALNDFNGGDVDTVKRWVAGGCEGPQPLPDAKERARLTARLAETTRAAEIARTAGADLDAETARLYDRLASLSRQILVARLAGVMDEVPAIERQIVDAIRTQRENLSKLKALAIALGDELTAAMARGDTVNEAGLRAAIVRIHETQYPPDDTTYQDVVAASAAWRERLK